MTLWGEPELVVWVVNCMEIGGFSLVGVGVYKGTSSDFGTSGHIIMFNNTFV